MKIVTEDEAVIGVWIAAIKRAIDDVTGKGFQVSISEMKRSEIREEAREWLIEDLPYILAAHKEMDIIDIEATREVIRDWVRCGCPQDGSFGIGI